MTFDDVIPNASRVEHIDSRCGIFVLLPSADFHNSHCHINLSNTPNLSPSLQVP